MVDGLREWRWVPWLDVWVGGKVVCVFGEDGGYLRGGLRMLFGGW